MSNENNGPEYSAHTAGAKRWYEVEAERLAEMRRTRPVAQEKTVHDDQPDGIDPDSFELPAPEQAAERVATFLRTYGDGLIVVDFDSAPPLYARDLEVLCRAWLEKAAERDAEIGNLRIDRDIALADAQRAFDSVDEYRTQLRDARIEIDVLRTYYANRNTGLTNND